MLEWIDRWTFYKRYGEVQERFGAYFSIESREIDYFLFRLDRSRLRLLSPLFSRMRFASRFACRHLSGAVLVMRKSAHRDSAMPEATRVQSDWRSLAAS